jgi:hypothetical protein
MKRIALIALLFGAVAPAFAKTHQYVYSTPCSALWPAVQDTLQHSGKYGVIDIHNADLSASYTVGYFALKKRINVLDLSTQGSGCALQVHTTFRGLAHNDSRDLKKRVDVALVKLPAAQPAKPEVAPAPSPAASN